MKPTIIAVGLLAACAAPVDPPGFPTSGTPPSINQVNVSDITNDMTVQVPKARPLSSDNT